MRKETIAERIKRRRLELGLSPEYVAEKIGKSRATYYRYESDEIEKMPIRALKPLADVLQVSVGYILTGRDEANIKRVPLLGSVAAGQPVYAAEEYGEYVVISGDTPVQVDFCLRVKGDSMIDARIKDGDIVFVRAQPTVENGEIAVVLIDGEVTLKRVYVTPDGLILKPENSKYAPIFVRKDEGLDVRILGKAVMFQSML